MKVRRHENPMTAAIGAHIERQYRKIDGFDMAGNVTRLPEYHKRNACSAGTTFQRLLQPLFFL
jgi:hypothetical protein